ncbi:MAG: hypothetical protein V1859_06330 [archaeon]
MLNILYQLKPFFEDVFREISVREYSRECTVSPPTASKILKNLEKEEILLSSKKGIYMFFRANKDNYMFRQLAKTYWYSLIYPLTEDLFREISFRRIILFGSLAKAENTGESDMDIFLDVTKRVLISAFHKRIKRNVQFHFAGEMQNEDLKSSILEGVVIR